MANFKRKRPRTRSTHAHTDKHDGVSHYYWMSRWPAWWDILHHTRPKRSERKRLQRRVMREIDDPEAITWPLGNSKPHHYYW